MLKPGGSPKGFSTSGREPRLMPRCYSCGKFTKTPHRENDGRAERAYCDFCYAEREWKLDGRLDEDTGGLVSVDAPPLGWWERIKQFLGFGK